MLTRAQRDALLMLTYLYTRLGDTARAGVILRGLSKACPDEPRTGKFQAGLALLEEDFERVLRILGPLTSGAVLASDDAPLLLLKAKALWQLGRENECRNALDEYFYLVGTQS